jgi:lipid-A-disaccharide synthase-like uncharacterized protein
MQKVHPASLGNALIWAAAILGTVVVMHWSENQGAVVAVLGGAAGASITIVSNALRKIDSGESKVRNASGTSSNETS